jgi:hypothetical protein
LHDYALAIPKLHEVNTAHNILLLGYVRTAFAHQPSYLNGLIWPPENVCRDIDKWGGQAGNASAATCADTWPGLFPSGTAPGFRLDGLFLDEYASDNIDNDTTAYHNPDGTPMTRGQFYANAKAHARARGWSLVVGNSGGTTNDTRFLNYVSSIIIYENSSWPTASQLTVAANRGQLGILPYGVGAPSATQVGSVASKVKYIGAAANSWSTDSGQAFFDTLFASIDQNP